MNTIKLILTFALALALPAAAQTDAVKQLAPTGKLRVGVAYAPSGSPIFVIKEASGNVRGVARDIGVALAKALDVPYEVVSTATTGELVEALKAGTLDIGFMPMDDSRRKVLDFSPPYFIMESTYLAGGATAIQTAADVDRTEVTVVGINGSTTFRAAERSLKAARIVPAKSIDEAVAMMKAGNAQALALTRDSLMQIRGELPNSRVLDGAFQVTGVAIGIQKERPAALAFVKEFVDKAKTNGIIRRAFDDAGLNALTVAP